jgi:hypothetical protein
VFSTRGQSHAMWKPGYTQLLGRSYLQEALVGKPGWADPIEVSCGAPSRAARRCSRHCKSYRGTHPRPCSLHRLRTSEQLRNGTEKQKEVRMRIIWPNDQEKSELHKCYCCICFPDLLVEECSSQR